MPGANAQKCPCCGQRSNLRKVACAFCDAYAMTSRAQMAQGYHPCRCGLGELRPVCLLDLHATGDAETSRAAWAEYAYRYDHEPCPILSARAKRAAQTRKTRAAFAAVPDRSTAAGCREEMPF